MAVVRPLIGRGQVHLVRLDPTLGSEIRKTRPCVVVSPDELNNHLQTVIVAPMTTGDVYTRGVRDAVFRAAQASWRSMNFGRLM